MLDARCDRVVFFKNDTIRGEVEVRVPVSVYFNAVDLKSG